MEVIFFQQIIELVLLHFLKHLFSTKGVYSEVEVAHKEYLFVVLDGHASISEMILESSLKNLGYLIVAFFFAASARHEVAVDYHKGLIIEREPYAYGPFISCGTINSWFYFAKLKTRGIDAIGHFALHKDREIESYHGYVDVNQLFLKEFVVCYVGVDQSRCAVVNEF